MYHAYNVKREKKRTKEIEPPNQERIRTLRDKENYEYLGIFEVGTVKLR